MCRVNYLQGIMVPHLTTAQTGPLLELERRFLDSMPVIEHWLRTQWLEHAVPFYASVDLRNSGFKLAPVDTNLFPGGFNNLNPDFLPLCVLAMQSAVEKICPEARGVLLIPENHTRNLFYLQNVVQIVTSSSKPGCACGSVACCRRSPKPPCFNCPAAAH